MKSSKNEVKLQEVRHTPLDINILYELLEERTSVENISHSKMPSYNTHATYVASKPYLRWWLITVDEIPIGATYITRKDGLGCHAIGIGVLKKYRRLGYATKAIKLVIKEAKWLEIDLVANINPANLKSIKLFKKLGFKHIQNSYKLEI